MRDDMLQINDSRQLQKTTAKAMMKALLAAEDKVGDGVFDTMRTETAVSPFSHMDEVNCL